MHQLHLSFAGALVATLVAGVAGAEDKSSAAKASALFEEGRRLMAAEKYAEACPKLAESQALDPAPDTAFDLGICYQRASQAAFETARQLAGASDRIDAAVYAPLRAPVLDEKEISPGKTQRVVGLVIGGVGVAGMITGVIAGLVAKSEYDSASGGCNTGADACTQSRVDQSRSAVQLANVSTISFLTGAAAAGAGAIVFFTAPKSKGGEGAVVGVGPATEGAGLSIAGRF